MKLTYIRKKGERVKYQFMGFTTFDEGWWFNKDLNKWQKREHIAESASFSSHQECRTVKAFRRKLKKAPKGVVFHLASRWVGFDVIGVGSFNYL